MVWEFGIFWDKEFVGDCGGNLIVRGGVGGEVEFFFKGFNLVRSLF